MYGVWAASGPEPMPLLARGMLFARAFLLGPLTLACGGGGLLAWVGTLPGTKGGMVCPYCCACMCGEKGIALTYAAMGEC